MSIEAIDEYLAIAKHCVTTEKAPGAIYGYPAILLLFSVVDALSNYLGHPKHSFQILSDFDPSLRPPQIKSLKNWYRNLPAHQAIIMPGTALSREPTGSPIEFGQDGEPTLVRVLPFYNLVKDGWDNFDRTKVSPRFEVEQAPKTGVDLPEVPGVNGYMTSGKV